MTEIDLEKSRGWFSRQKGLPDIFYASVDLRRGAGRLCPVDVNLFPAGFNNLCKTDAEHAPPVLREALARRGVKDGGAVGIVAESHTRNPYYAEHLHALVGLIRRAGYRAEASCPECADDVLVRSASGETLTMMSIGQKAGRIVFGTDFVPDFLLLNNDLATGIPPTLENVSQPMTPATDRGWFVRRKHQFFEAYAKLAGDFCGEVGLDTRAIVPRSILVSDINFKDRAGLDRITAAVDAVLSESGRWNAEHGISEPPVAIVKSNYGTYGMAVMSVSSPDEILQMNRKTINKMHVGKGKIQTTEVLVQEGIPTEDAVDGCPAEPVVYLIDGEPAGAFYRHHCERGNKYNLNVSGMAFKPICLHEDLGSHLPLVLTVARVAARAAALEQNHAN